MYLYQLARDANVNNSCLERAVRNGGVSCESEFGGNFIDGLAEIPNDCLNLVYLHANLFGVFPIVSLPDVNMIVLWPEMTRLNNEKGLSSLISRLLLEVPSIPKPDLSHEELFSVVQFLSCVWTDIRTFSYQYQAQLYWNPLVSFDTPMYYRAGSISNWNPSCNILRAEILEIINSIYRLLLCSYGYYKHCFHYANTRQRPPKRKVPKTDFILNNSNPTDIYTYPGVQCLASTNARTSACSILTIVRIIIGKLTCMLVRIPLDRISIKATTWSTLAEDLKQLYTMIQKMEVYLNI